MIDEINLAMSDKTLSFWCRIKFDENEVWFTEWIEWRRYRIPITRMYYLYSLTY